MVSIYWCSLFLAGNNRVNLTLMVERENLTLYNVTSPRASSGCRRGSRSQEPALITRYFWVGRCAEPDNSSTPRSLLPLSYNVQFMYSYVTNFYSFTPRNFFTGMCFCCVQRHTNLTVSLSCRILYKSTSNTPALSSAEVSACNIGELFCILRLCPEPNTLCDGLSTISKPMD